MRVLFMTLLLLAFNANAWMDKWAPPFKAASAKVRVLPAQSVRSFVLDARDAQGAKRYEDIHANYSEGGALDLNGDGIELTAADWRKIAEKTRPVSRTYVP